MIEPYKPSSTSILIVDDTPENLRLLVGILSNAGYQIRPARDGRTALQSARAAPPDLILLDILMPEMDGYEVCRRLKADPRTEAVPVIFISALDDIEGKMKSFALGAVDYVTKPFQAEEVLARVRTHITLYLLQKDMLEKIAELDAFAHTVAHDLKSPIAAIIGYAELLAEQFGTTLDTEVEEGLEYIRGSGYRANNIIQELLMLASVRKQDVDLRVVDMAEIVELAQLRVDYSFKEHGAQLILPEKWPKVMGYAPWLQEVWVNYLSNALKYGGRPPHIELGSEQLDDGFIRFWVRDNGPGISPEKQAVLFTEFNRMSELKAEGHGLGLSIVQRIISKLGGRVMVSSVVGAGSEFSFILPQAADYLP